MLTFPFSHSHLLILPNGINQWSDLQGIQKITTFASFINLVVDDNKRSTARNR